MISQGPAVQPRPGSPSSQWQAHQWGSREVPGNVGDGYRWERGKGKNGVQAHSSCGPWEAQSLGGQAQTTCLEDSLGPRLSSEELWKAWGKGQGAKGRFCPSPAGPHSHPLLPHTQAAGTEDPQPHSNAAQSDRAESELPRAAGSNQAGASLSCLGKTQFSCQQHREEAGGQPQGQSPRQLCQQ